MLRCQGLHKLTPQGLVSIQTIRMTKALDKCCAVLQIKFIFGYSVKLQSVVKRKGGVRTLTLPFSTPIQNILVHDLTMKVRQCLNELS